MITLVFLKALCDLGIYYTFAGFFAVLLGAAPALLLAALPLQALCFAAAFPLRRGRLRYLPLAALLLCWLLPGVGLAEAVTFLPPAAYLVWLTVKGRFFPEWSHQVDIFSRFWKLLFPFLLLALVFGGAGAVTAITIPAGSVTLLCSVLLNRTLRHDPEVYCQRRCQLLNLAVVALAGLCALLLSTPAFLRGCLACLRALYTYLITPILMLLVYAAVGLLSAVMWLLSRISLGAQGQENAVELDLQSAAETLGLQEAAGDLPAYLEQAALAIAILAAILILGAVFRYLARRSAGAPPRPGGRRAAGGPVPPPECGERRAGEPLCPACPGPVPPLPQALPPGGVPPLPRRHQRRHRPLQPGDPGRGGAPPPGALHRRPVRRRSHPGGRRPGQGALRSAQAAAVPAGKHITYGSDMP